LFPPCSKRIDTAGYLTIPFADRLSKRVHYTADQIVRLHSNRAAYTPVAIMIIS